MTYLREFRGQQNAGAITINRNSMNPTYSFCETVAGDCTKSQANPLRVSGNSRTRFPVAA